MNWTPNDWLKRFPTKGRAAVRAGMFGAGVALQMAGAVSNGWLWLAGIGVTAMSFVGLSDAT